MIRLEVFFGPIPHGVAFVCPMRITGAQSHVPAGGTQEDGGLEEEDLLRSLVRRPRDPRPKTQALGGA